MNTHELSNWFTTYKELSLYGRYIHLEHINPLIEILSKKDCVEFLGTSENNAPIHLIKLGNGPKKLLFWSQMHGNESTTTKGIFDFINMLNDGSNELSKHILTSCTLYIIPMLSPDGAKAYTRLNYNQVDLNRDAQNRTQKESVILSKVIQRVQPHYAFNLHGQRTIFSAGEVNSSATVSFLSPAGDKDRSITPCRKIAMEIISEINTVLQQCIPNSIGRYDDGFNINCVGDTLSDMEIPTILFEAGHYKDDYGREKTREFIFYALIRAVGYISEKNVTGEYYQKYFDIPENGKCFYDIIIRDVILDKKNVDIAIQYTEKLSENAVKFIPKIEKIGDLEKFYGHREIIGNKREIYNENVTVEVVRENQLLKFRLNDELFSTELRKS
ncbi:M14 family zinc carboxypeptidase [Aquimarina sp. 2201CG14-23]|uniref:M14 family zinc carboxypeptidase n=1 Tax=Aquimarina mycalae TaxID=3040073 RepID=UPI00247800BA|nr:M14 family zinc carboxypeptidase [Aquimarina sp. 2201CG14-23]MDH7445781.1 M14 family zinc carboxypeptidase [Aquimarina sp. 2201CG14-23]